MRKYVVSMAITGWVLRSWSIAKSSNVVYDAIESADGEMCDEVYACMRYSFGLFIVFWVIILKLGHNEHTRLLA